MAHWLSRQPSSRGIRSQIQKFACKLDWGTKVNTRCKTLKILENSLSFFVCHIKNWKMKNEILKHLVKLGRNEQMNSEGLTEMLMKIEAWSCYWNIQWMNIWIFKLVFWSMQWMNRWFLKLVYWSITECIIYFVKGLAKPK